MTRQVDIRLITKIDTPIKITIEFDDEYDNEESLNQLIKDIIDSEEIKCLNHSYVYEDAEDKFLKELDRKGKDWKMD